MASLSQTGYDIDQTSYDISDSSGSSSPGMSRNNKILLGFFLLAGLGVGLYFIFGHHHVQNRKHIQSHTIKVHGGHQANTHVATHSGIENHSESPHVVPPKHPGQDSNPTSSQNNNTAGAGTPGSTSTQGTGNDNSNTNDSTKPKPPEDKHHDPNENNAQGSTSSPSSSDTGADDGKSNDPKNAGNNEEKKPDGTSNNSTGGTSKKPSKTTHVATFTRTGTFTVPEGVNRIFVTGIGGGGSGGNGGGGGGPGGGWQPCSDESTLGLTRHYYYRWVGGTGSPGNNGGGGGAGGSGAMAINYPIDVVPGEIITIIIGYYGVPNSTAALPGIKGSSKQVFNRCSDPEGSAIRTHAGARYSQADGGTDGKTGAQGGNGGTTFIIKGKIGTGITITKANTLLVIPGGHGGQGGMGGRGGSGGYLQDPADGLPDGGGDTPETNGGKGGKGGDVPTLGKLKEGTLLPGEDGKDGAGSPSVHGGYGGYESREEKETSFGGWGSSKNETWKELRPLKLGKPSSSGITNRTASARYHSGLVAATTATIDKMNPVGGVAVPVKENVFKNYGKGGDGGAGGAGTNGGNGQSASEFAEKGGIGKRGTSGFVMVQYSV